MDFEINALNWTHNYFQSEALTIWVLILTDKNNLLWPGVATVLAFLYLKKKQGLLFILTAAITILLADGISENIIKPLIAHARPCTTQDFIRNQDNFFLNSVHCSPSFSFPSTQAVNLFALATLWAGFFGKSSWVIFVLALWTGWTRIYLGLHYPSDILGGMFIGVAMGFLGVKLSRLGSSHSKEGSSA